MTPPHGGADPPDQIRALNVKEAPQASPHGELGFELPQATTVSRGRVVVIGIVVVAVLGVAFVVGYLPRRQDRAVRGLRL